MSIDKLKTKFFTGAWLTDVKHYFTKINEIIDYLNGDGKSGDGSYKVYIALLTQSGTNAPVPTILVNTIGNIKWTYSGPGQGTYNGTLNGMFIANKTFFMINKSRGSGKQFSLYRTSDDEIEIRTEVFDGGVPTFTASDNVLNKTSIEIRVYN